MSLTIPCNTKDPIPAAQINAAHLVIRPLTAEDAAAYRALRKKILETGDGRYFSDSYIRESRFNTDEQWREWCTETQEHCIIGTFVDGDLVGIMGIVMYGPRENRAVEWEATWLDPRYRGCGIAKRAYEAVYKWTKDYGYKYAVVLIRDENIRSREIREKQGATYIHTRRNETWADGSIGDVHCFILDISASRFEQDNTYTEATRCLEATLAFLKHDDLSREEKLKQRQ